LLLHAPGPQSWAVSHAALPAVSGIDGDGFWLYYSPRDEAGRAHVARARVNATDTGLSIDRHDPEPVLSPGRIGAFDDSGVTVSCLVADGGVTRLYYTGWSLGRTVPFYFYAGLAESVDGGATFRRVSEAPILERTAVDPFLTASPCVLRGPDGRWSMWYVSCIEWLAGDGPPRHEYHVRYASSDDGLQWHRDGQVALGFEPGEYAIARPCVRYEAGRYRMWTCARGLAYRLVYAESTDGLEWTRMPAPLEPSPDGWDAEMQAYPWIVEVAGGRHLLYNGNGYGRTGVGYATARKASTG
jgi:hypothetical protein